MGTSRDIDRQTTLDLDRNDYLGVGEYGKTHQKNALDLEHDACVLY